MELILDVFLYSFSGCMVYSRQHSILDIWHCSAVRLVSYAAVLAISEQVSSYVKFTRMWKSIKNTMTHTYTYTHTPNGLCSHIQFCKTLFCKISYQYFISRCWKCWATIEIWMLIIVPHIELIIWKHKTKPQELHSMPEYYFNFNQIKLN